MKPNQAYYRACIGSWTCRLEFAITDWDRFRAAPIAALDRLRIRASLALGAQTFSTTVAMPTDDEVVHTSRVSKLGAPMLASREVLTLDPDGRRFTMHVVQRDAPLFVPARSYDARGHVDDSATRATYELELFGCPMHQTTLREGDLVTVTQETEWSRGVQRLVRVG